MSWSVHFIGTAAKVAQALKEQSEKFQGPSKIEYDHALPHLVGIVEQNFTSNGDPAIIKLSATGYGYVVDGEPKDSTLTITLERLHNTLV